MLIDLLHEDARWAMPPAALWFDGRVAIMTLFQLYPIGWQGDFRMVPARSAPAAGGGLLSPPHRSIGVPAGGAERLARGGRPDLRSHDIRPQPVPRFRPTGDVVGQHRRSILRMAGPMSFP